MPLLRLLRELSPKQRSAALASYLGWTLDAFDFFILVFIMEDIAREFGTDLKAVTYAIFLTLAARPIGALAFGVAADRFGRRPVLMINILAFSLLEFASGLAPGLGSFLILRALFGVAMGGEWGVGASLTMESIPTQARGAVSGILQAGYPSGYLLASVAYFAFYGLVGWRGMFFLGVLPALLVVYIRAKVEESPAFVTHALKGQDAGGAGLLQGNAKLFVYAILLMTAFNFFSHGTQDLYPTFLSQQHHFSPRAVGLIAIAYNIGAIVGGIFFGSLSEKVGRCRGILIAALGALCLIPLWAYGTSVWMLTIGAILMQFAVQGAWGIVPAYLNEISPHNVRGTFPGLAYQIGNLLASSNATLQASLAEANGGNYAQALSLVTAIVAVVLVGLTLFGIEARGVKFHGAPENPVDG